MITPQTFWGLVAHYSTMLTKTPHISPVRLRFWVSFVSWKSHLWSAAVVANIVCNMMAYCTTHNGTTLYMHHWNRPLLVQVMACGLFYCINYLENVLNNNTNPWFPPIGHCYDTATNTHVSTYPCWSLGVPVISTNIRTVGVFVKTAIILQWKCLCVQIAHT